MQKSFLFLFFLLYTNGICAQYNLTAVDILPVSSDTISYYSIERLINYGGSGKDVIWDFSYFTGDTLYDKSIFLNNSLNQFYKIENRELKSYVLADEILGQNMYQDRLTKITYSKRKMVMKFPFEYGDSITSSFEGNGTYCGDHLIKVIGNVYIHADGFGKIILSDKDTIDNVLRVYTLTTTAIALGKDTAEIDSTNLKQEIEEKYEWYIKDRRYPIYTTVSKTSFSNLEAVAKSSFTYVSLPKKYLDVVERNSNEETKKEDDNRQRNEIKFDYVVECENEQVKISYTSNKDVNIIALISNAQGMLFKKERHTAKENENGNIIINTNGLRRGIYILYINVEGKVYSNTIKIK